MSPDLRMLRGSMRIAKVRGVLEQYPKQALTIVQIAERTELRTATVSVALQRLAANGEVARHNGLPPRWSLVPGLPPRDAA